MVLWDFRSLLVGDLLLYFLLFRLGLLVIQTPDQYTRTVVLPIFTLKQSKARCDWGNWAFLCGA